jgi:hypothetical protein
MSFLAKVGAYIKWHYSDVTLRRSDKQIQREQKLLGLIPFNRWMLVPAAVLVQLCIGSLYSYVCSKSGHFRSLALLEDRTRNDHKHVASP